MEERKRVAVIGGDARQTAAGRALARAGYEVCGPVEQTLRRRSGWAIRRSMR